MKQEVDDQERIRAKERPGKDTVPQKRKVRVEGKDAELKRKLKGKGVGPTEAQKTTEVERPTKANEPEDAEAIRRLKVNWEATTRETGRTENGTVPNAKGRGPEGRSSFGRKTKG